MKKVIITWTSSGIWRSLAQTFYDAGYEVVWISRSNKDEFINFVSCNLTDEQKVEEVCQTLLEKHSEFDCIIHCAWDGFWESIDNLQWSKTERTFQLNAIAPIVITSKLLDVIKSNNADVINIWATIWFKPYHHFSVYGSSKWALRWWTENLQLELKKTQSRVIWVHPGWVDTAGNDRRRENIKKLTWNDIGTWFMSPDEIAKFIFQIFQLPKSMEVSEVIINRK